ncbi:hypothetical protein FNV43_RR00884 [Rhamnella rubrinervis]|uniref:RING-type domain-containing protein n=1 Tax=Rhamnella rubrinervis TaxID=2594499 RepID=A0A8K0HPZ4_9ROSA|nr:hypothetical protein FNV43_RR00884 [Rhamnella rubrinervis]
MAASARDVSPPDALICSICLEDVDQSCVRTVVKLKCSHLFHLDCIGSAFNVKGVMECPNCREIENGVWKRFQKEGTEENSLNHIHVEDAQRFHGMEHHNFLRCPHRWEMALQSLGYGNSVDHHAIFDSNHNNNHQQNGPIVPSGISFSEPFYSFDHHHQFCDQCFRIVSVSGHTSGANWVGDPFMTLRTASAGLHGIPNELLVHRTMFDFGAPHQNSLNSSIGLARQGSIPPAFDNFHQVQSPIDSLSQMLHASMLSTMRRPNGSRAYFQAAGHLGSSLEQAMSYIVPSTNFTNQNVFDTTTLIDQPVQETHDTVPLQLFPNDFDSFFAREA